MASALHIHQQMVKRDLIQDSSAERKDLVFQSGFWKPEVLSGNDGCKNYEVLTEECILSENGGCSGLCRSLQLTCLESECVTSLDHVDFEDGTMGLRNRAIRV